MDASAVLENVPTLSDMYRIFPVALHTLGIFLLGYWVGRNSLSRLIDHLEKRKP
jgi:hypothetical protein